MNEGARQENQARYRERLESVGDATNDRLDKIILLLQKLVDLISAQNEISQESQESEDDNEQ